MFPDSVHESTPLLQRALNNANVFSISIYVPLLIVSLLGLDASEYYIVDNVTVGAIRCNVAIIPLKRNKLLM